MKYIEATDNLPIDGPSLFLAGGISGTHDWQREILRLLSDTRWTLINPRRRKYHPTPEAAREQIHWEFQHLRRATARLFWFPPPTLCPIALFELGAWSQNQQPLFVGVHPDYQRRLDIEIQLSLARPDVQIVDTLEGLAAQVRKFLRSIP